VSASFETGIVRRSDIGLLLFGVGRGELRAKSIVRQRYTACTSSRPSRPRSDFAPGFLVPRPRTRRLGQVRLTTLAARCRQRDLASDFTHPSDASPHRRTPDTTDGRISSTARSADAVVVGRTTTVLVQRALDRREPQSIDKRRIGSTYVTWYRDAKWRF
jgi:hypothetical protein